MTQSPGVPLLQDAEPPENMVCSQLSSVFYASIPLAVLGVESRTFCVFFFFFFGLEGTGLLSLSKMTAGNKGGSSCRGHTQLVYDTH